MHMYIYIYIHIYFIYIYIYIYTHTHTYNTYIYIYMYRERERERERDIHTRCGRLFAASKVAPRLVGPGKGTAEGAQVLLLSSLLLVVLV